MKGNRLKRVSKLIQYSSILISLVLILTASIFCLNAAKIIGINIPFITPSVRIDNHTYRFGKEYVEVRRINSALEEFTGIKIAERIYTPKSYFDSAIKDLYKLDLEKFRKYPSHGTKISLVLFDKQPRLFPLRYFTYEKIPEVVVGFSLLLVFLSVLVLIVSNNIVKLIDNAIEESLFKIENAERIKYIGFYFLIGETVRLLIFFWVNNSIAHMEWFNSQRMSYFPSISEINFSLIVAGIVLLIISKIVSISAAIKQENDLPV